jgi:hypothetical protein
VPADGRVSMAIVPAMNKTRPAEEQIALAPRPEEAGKAVAAILRRLGVSLISLSSWALIPRPGPPRDGSNSLHQVAALRASQSLDDAQAERPASNSSAPWNRALPAPAGPLNGAAASCRNAPTATRANPVRTEHLPTNGSALWKWLKEFAEQGGNDGVVA